jgi:hypothetical protein
VAIYRELYSQQPGAYAANFAVSLNFHSDRLAETGDQQGAARAAEEAVRVLEPVFRAYPQALADRMGYMLGDYVKRYQAAGLKPDPQLLARIQTVLEQQPKQ